jgi:peptidoglycan/LPS O-acetylase OafA/YrhL
VAVLTMHAVGVYGRGAGDDWLRPWVMRLDVAVPIFFLLSGFLLYRPFVVARREGLAMPSVVAYGWRRVLRVLPGYWVALTLAVLVLGLPGVFTATGVVRYYGFLQSYDSATVAGGLPQAWTLCVDAAFYVLLPLVAIGVRRLAPGPSLRPELRVLAVIALLSLAWKAWVLLSLAGDHTTATDPWMIALPAFMDQFAAGMALAVLSVRWEDQGATPAWVRRRPGAWWLAALALFAASCWGFGFDHVAVAGFSHEQAILRHLLALGIAVCVIVPAVVGEGWPNRFLGLRPLRRLGTISYGVYLYHLTVLGLLGRWHLNALEDVVPRQLLWFVAALAGTLVLAELSWRLIEAPALGLKPPLWRGPRLRRGVARPAREPRG